MPTRVIMGIAIFNFLLAKIATKIMGAINAVPAKLVRASNTNSSLAIKENTRVVRAKKNDGDTGYFYHLIILARQ